MNAEQRLRALYEISLAVESQETVPKTAETALEAYLEQLDCSVGAVFTTVKGLSPVAAVPTEPERSDLLAAACAHLESCLEADIDRGHATDEQRSHEMGDTSIGSSLPATESVTGVGTAHLFSLPGFGVLILGTEGAGLDDETIAALPDLNETVARACASAAKRQRQPQRFEAVFEALPYPVVAVTTDGTTERVVEVNERFEQRFGYEGDTIRGRAVDTLVRLPDSPFERDRLMAALDRGESLEAEVQRETSSGTESFLFSAVPLETQSATEYIGTYVDITERKRPEQTLDELYGAVQELLVADSREQVCTQAVETVASVFDYATVGIHLYNRETEALEPAATTERVREQFGDPPRYTIRDTVIWEAYEARTPVRIDDTEDFDGTLPDDETPAGSAVILPIGVHGVLITSAVEPDAFGDQEWHLLRLLSQLVTVALDRSTTRNRLAGVQREISEAFQAETHEEMAETVLDAIPTLLNFPIAGVWRYRPARDVLEPLEMTEDAMELFGAPPTFSEDDGSIAWQTFESGSTTIVSDASQHPDAYNPETPIRGEIIVPIGEYGVLTAGSTYEDSFTQFDAEILEILATNLEVVAEVIDSRQDVALLEQVIARILRHNVRNKLTPIRGYANTIVEQVDQPLKSHAEAIVENCDELARTAEHAREMRTVIRARDEMTTVSLAKAIRAVAETVDAEFPDGELLVNIDATPRVTAHTQLTTALRHLVRNGFDHNDSEQPRVVVTVEDGEAGPTVEIADNGPGIDTHELDVIDRHGESALEHGSGAGLWIIDRVIEYSEARLSFETTDGTTATITFPQ